MIKLENVTKTYGDYRAVDDVSFEARAGQVTGFLGPNGAGKSTSMRIMVGLTPPDRGSATIGGHRYADIPNPGRHVGVLLDASAQHAGRSGREVRFPSALRARNPSRSRIVCWGPWRARARSRCRHSRESPAARLEFASASRLRA